jgi:hypothetical protein
MRFLERVPEDAVVRAFLRAELGSARFGARLTELLGDVPPEDVFTRDAEFRRNLLARHRGWRSEGLFDGLPEEVEWYRVAAKPDEVLDIRFIKWDWWLRISDGTREPRVAAERIRRGLVPGGDPGADEPIAAALRGSQRPPELIALAPPERSPVVLIEGHVRLTAYALFPQYLPDELELFVGIAENAREWSEF